MEVKCFETCFQVSGQEFGIWNGLQWNGSIAKSWRREVQSSEGHIIHHFTVFSFRGQEFGICTLVLKVDEIGKKRPLWKGGVVGCFKTPGQSHSAVQIDGN